MNYRHAYHAGNFADVMKHTAFVAVLRYLALKSAPFAVIDTHAGRGLYDLAGMEAGKTGEAAEGIGRLRGASNLPALLQDYVAVAGGEGEGKYRGSPLIAARIGRPKDRLVAIERHDDEFTALSVALRPYARARAILGDGYRELPGLLPPPERRGVILIDPPYEADDEFQQLSRGFAAAFQRFATGIYLIWLPMKTRADADALAGELLNTRVRNLLLLTLDAGRAPEALPERLSESGLFVVNPPYGFTATMQAALAYLAQRLAQGESASFSAEWLAGEE